MTFADSHCHLYDSRLSERCGEIITKAKLNQVTLFLQGGVGPEDWDLQLNLRNQSPSILPVFGIHPCWVSEHSESECELALDKLAKKTSLAVAIGEIGLDYRPSYIHSNKQDLQLSLFEKQLELAEVSFRPVVLHVVKAHSDVLRILNLRGVPKRGGLVHGFSSSWQVAKEYIRLGFYISLGRQFTRSRRMQAELRNCPIDRILIESDCPDQFSEPSDIWKVAQVVGANLNLPDHEVLDISTRNLRKLLSL